MSNWAFWDVCEWECGRQFSCWRHTMQISLCPPSSSALTPLSMLSSTPASLSSTAHPTWQSRFQYGNDKTCKSGLNAGSLCLHMKTHTRAKNKSCALLLNPKKSVARLQFLFNLWIIYSFFMSKLVRQS